MKVRLINSGSVESWRRILFLSALVCSQRSKSLKIPALKHGIGPILSDVLTRIVGAARVKNKGEFQGQKVSDEQAKRPSDRGTYPTRKRKFLNGFAKSCDRSRAN